ncbi:hypothetical protein [Dyella subtropica]|uniref:hypothetical protein n=1 Tax=Dyella subtropica TaxID=2992127 RepID=UPI002258CB83|nr:hypothetical protein [Dyella subtropica]
MKNAPATTSSALDAEQGDLRQRKVGVMVSSLGYWFVIGIVCVIYARYLGGTRPFFVLMVQEYRPLTELLAVAIVGTRLFTYQWVRLDAMERTDQLSTLQTLLHAVFFSEYLARTRTLRKNLVTALVQAAVIFGSIVTCWVGVHVASEALLK